MSYLLEGKLEGKLEVERDVSLTSLYVMWKRVGFRDWYISTQKVCYFPLKLSPNIQYSPYLILCSVNLAPAKELKYGKRGHVGWFAGQAACSSFTSWSLLRQMLIQSFGWQNTQILLGATWWVCAILSGLIVVDNINARGASKKSSKGLKMGKLIPLKVNPR